MGAVVGYSAVHLGAFAVMGVVASAVLTQAEEAPPLLLGAVLLFVGFEAAFMGFIAIGAEFLLGPLAWTSIAFANVLAAGGDGVLPVAQAPEAARRLRRESAGQDSLRGAPLPSARRKEAARNPPGSRGGHAG